MSLPRLYLLRLGYLLVAVGFALTKWPLPINHDRPGWVSSSSPLWLARQLDPATVKVFYSCLVVLIVLAVVPWRYVAGVLIALPLALQESVGDAARGRTIVVTKRSLILSIWALVIFVDLCYGYGQSFNMLTAVCVVLPAILAVSRVWGARRGRIEHGLLRHPLRRELRPHLVQVLNIWLCCGLLGGILAAGGTHYARIGFSLNAAQFHLMIGSSPPASSYWRRWRSSPPTCLCGHQHGCGAAVGVPRRPARPRLGPGRSGPARLATGW